MYKFCVQKCLHQWSFVCVLNKIGTIIYAKTNIHIYACASNKHGKYLIATQQTYVSLQGFLKTSSRGLQDELESEKFLT